MGVLRALLVTMALALPAMARGHVVVTEAKVEILEPVRWIGTTTVPMASAWRTFDAVAETMRNNPAIAIEVIGFGSDLAKATPIAQVGLGKQRADVIVAELVRRGVEPRRLSASGEARPRHGIDPVPLFVLVDRPGR